MHGLAKLALNAQKARHMAKEVGLIPEGNWKWALRNLRDGRGNPLEGRNLDEAQQRLGKLPNNVRQQVHAASRKYGSNKEIGLDIMSDGMRSPIIFGDEKSVSSNVGKGLQNEIHTHPYKGAVRHKNSSKQLEYAKRKFGGPEYATKMRKFRGILNKQDEAIQGPGRKDHRLVRPSGLALAKNPKPKEASFSQEEGDYGVWLAQELFQKGINHNIIDPLFGNEGVYRLRPDFVRSVYFKNKGEYN